MGKSALVFSFFGKWGKSPLSCIFWRFQFDAGWGNAISSTHKLRGCKGHHVSGKYSVTSPQPRARGPPFFSFFEAKMAQLRWFSEFLCNFNPRRGIQFICQAIGMRGAMWYMIELGHYIGLGYISCPLGTSFNCLGPKWVHFGGLRYVCTISTLAGGFNHIYEQYIRMGGELHYKLWRCGSPQPRGVGRSKAKGLQPQSPRPWAYIACEAVNPLFRCDLIPLKLLYYDVIICRVIQVNYVLNEIYAGLNAFN